MTRLPVRIAILTLMLATGACNATGATPIAPAVTPAPTVAATPAPIFSTPASLRGTWTANIQGTTASSGLWTMAISESSVTLQNPIGGEPFSIGATAVSETSLLLAADADCPTQGTYTLALTGDSLTITAVSDSCGDRKGVLASEPWVRKP